MNLPNVIDTERLYDLANVYEVDDSEVRIVLSKLLEKLNLVPVRIRYIRKGEEMVAYDLEPIMPNDKGE
jgi:hypothetical protein